MGVKTAYFRLEGKQKYLTVESEGINENEQTSKWVIKADSHQSIWRFVIVELDYARMDVITLASLEEKLLLGTEKWNIKVIKTEVIKKNDHLVRNIRTVTLQNTKGNYLVT